MSIHPSLSSSIKNRKQKSVLSRVERIKYLKGKGLFSDETAVFGLPKIKTLKIKIKKEKAAEKATAAATVEGAVPAAEAQAAAKPSKESSSSKAAK